MHKAYQEITLSPDGGSFGKLYRAEPKTGRGFVILYRRIHPNTPRRKELEGIAYTNGGLVYERNSGAVLAAFAQVPVHADDCLRATHLTEFNPTKMVSSIDKGQVGAVGGIGKRIIWRVRCIECSNEYQIVCPEFSVKGGLQKIGWKYRYNGQFVKRTWICPNH